MSNQKFDCPVAIGVKDDNRLENLELWTRAHPDGQRVEDVFEWCVEFIERYAREQG